MPSSDASIRLVLSMEYVQETSQKVQVLRNAFSPHVGRLLTGYECAELHFEETDSWDRWDDMPVRLRFGESDVVSVAWTEFDDLLVTPDESLPDWYSVSTNIRWVDRDISELDSCIDRTLKNIMLGRGEMSIEGNDVEVWNRLVLEFDGIWFEIYNALDKNGYAQQPRPPEGEFLKCE